MLLHIFCILREYNTVILTKKTVSYCQLKQYETKAKTYNWFFTILLAVKKVFMGYAAFQKKGILERCMI